MKQYFIHINFFIFLILLSAYSFSQIPFVTFQTTAGSSEVCQGKTVGVIATLDPMFEENYNGIWLYDEQNFREVQDEIAIVNTLSTGEKRLRYSLGQDKKAAMDTVFIVNVLPKPFVKIDFDGRKISLTSNENEFNSFKWFHNGSLLENSSAMINNPQEGSYRLVATDINGCVAASDEIKIE